MLNLQDTSDVKEVYIYTYSEVAVQAKGRIALAQIVFQDGSYASMIYQAFPDGIYRWRPPYLYLQQSGSEEDNVALIGGPLEERLAQIAAGSQNFLKSKVESVPYASTFRITRESVEQLPNPPQGLVL